MAYSNIKDPSAYFQTALYTGTGSAHSIGNDGNSDLKPDWVWIKKRSASGNHSVFDSTRGAYEELITNGTNAEATDVQLLTQFDTDGFTVGTNGGVNGSGATFVAWQWKANGGTTSSNTDGTITSTVQANTDAGFSIVTYTGTGATATVGHGLGVAPKIIIGKRRNSTSNWWFGGSILTSTQTMYPNLTNGIDTVSESVLFNVTTSTTFKLGTDTNRNAASGTHVAYCFAEKQGYSKFGSYVGNGSTDGPFVYTGFKPAFVMIKRTDSAANWDIFTGKISTFNIVSDRLRANLSDAEQTGFDRLDFVSNGFKIKNTNTTGNTSGGTYIYMAFAENPFVAGGVPTTAR